MTDLLYNSNVELRNEYLRLRDGSPYGLAQTPMFSASNGSSFADLIYTTDAYNRVGFSYAGSNWVEAPYQPKNFSSEWVVRNSTAAGFRMTFTTPSLIVMKTMTLLHDSRDATLTYTVSPLKQVQLHSMNLSLWIPFDETIGNLTRSGGTYELALGGQAIQVSSDPLPSNASLGVVGGQHRVLFEYKISAETFLVTLALRFPSATRSTWSQGVYGMTSDEIIKTYGVSYLVAPNQPSIARRFSSDPRLTQSYGNSNLLIFEVKGGA